MTAVEPWISALAQRVSEVTPARVFSGRAGTSYTTAASLKLRADHAAARDAVGATLDVTDALTGGRPFTLAATQAATHAEYLTRPDLGRRLATSLDGLAKGADLQLVLGDGLSATALAHQAPAMVDLLLAGAAEREWSVGDLVVVKRCRVGILNDVGEALDPKVVVLLIGERPGLATATSLSAYLAYRPKAGHTDGDRNLVSNIHRRGLPAPVAAARVLALAEAMVAAGVSGVAIKESGAATIAASAAALP